MKKVAVIALIIFSAACGDEDPKPDPSVIPPGCTPTWIRCQDKLIYNGTDVSTCDGKGGFRAWVCACPSGTKRTGSKCKDGFNDSEDTVEDCGTHGGVAEIICE
jgi:hypothetical protein